MNSTGLLCIGMVSIVARLARSQRLCSASTIGCLLLSACGGSVSDSSRQPEARDDQTQGVLTRLWFELRPDEDVQLPPIRFPADLSSHPEAASESFQLQAVFSREDGSMMSVQAQIDRLALGIGADSSSGWDFSDIMRASVAVGQSNQSTLEAGETIERRALGLANSDQESIYVIDTQLDLQPLSDDQAGLVTSDVCRVRYHFSTTLANGLNSTTDALFLDIAMPACPQTVTLRGLNRWQSGALQASATLGSVDRITAAADETLWQGHAWLSQTWGNMPPAGGAVLIDQVNLRLTTDSGTRIQLISASRTKRKTGRGPQSVQGTTSTLADGEQALELEWIDEGEQTSQITGLVYPQRFLIRSQNKSIDLLLTPVVALPELRDSLGIRWHGAVRVSGTHSGVGFVNFKPLSGGEQNMTNGR